MSLEDCRVFTKVPKVSVREGKRSAVFLNLERERYAVTRVDGCLLQQEVAADWAISKEEVGDIVIELKGRDVHHAVKQVHATAVHWHEEKYQTGKIAGLIVACQYPRSSTAVQKAQDAFAKRFKGPLHVVTKNYEFIFEKVLEFKGPL